MNAESKPSKSQDNYEISPRFSQTIEERIIRLERDAAADERMIATLVHHDHIRRHRRLIAVQLAEALRMRLFLERSTKRQPPTWT